jgi:SWIM/SEC-C metal-binding protein
MAKSGSKRNPLILRIADESKAQLVAEICSENDWQFILGIEPDQKEDLSDLERKLNPPVRHEVRKIGRNKPCTCGSGKKLKKCCGANN